MAYNGPRLTRWTCQRVWFSRWLVVSTLAFGASIFGFPDASDQLPDGLTDKLFVHLWNLA